MWWNDVHKVPSRGKFWSSRGGGMLVRYGEMLKRLGAVAFLSRMVPTQQMKAVMSALYCRPLSPSPFLNSRGDSIPPDRGSLLSAPPVIFSESSSFATSKPSSILNHPRYIQAHWRTTKCRDTPPPPLQHAV